LKALSFSNICWNNKSDLFTNALIARGL